MLQHIFLLFTIAVSAVGCFAPTQVHSQDNATPTAEEIMKQGNVITEERLAGYKDFDCGKIKEEFAFVADRYEYSATPRMIKGTLFVGGDLRFLIAIKELNKVTSEKGCDLSSFTCSDYPLTCEGMASVQ